MPPTVRLAAILRTYWNDAVCLVFLTLTNVNRFYYVIPKRYFKVVLIDMRSVFSCSKLLQQLEMKIARKKLLKSIQMVLLIKNNQWGKFD